MFTLTIETENDAFQHGPAGVLAVLREVTAKVGRGVKESTLLDTNGNTVGRFEWKEG